MNKYETNYMKKTCKRNKNRDTWIIKQNTHKPIIEKNKYDKVQEIKLGKQVKIKAKHEFLLRDLLYCGYCKKKLQYKIYKSADKQRFLYESSGFNCSLYYKKRCKNTIYIREKDLNEIIKKEIIKKLNLMEIDKITDKLIDYYKENNRDMQKIKQYQNEIQKLERKKSVLYKKKYEQYITIEKFKTEYIRAKQEIKKFDNLIKEIEQNHNNKLEERRIQEIIYEFKNGNLINNDFLKEIINRIEVYSKNRIEITFNL